VSSQQFRGFMHQDPVKVASFLFRCSQRRWENPPDELLFADCEIPHFVLSLPVDKVTLSLVLGRLAHTWLGFRSNKLLSAALGCTPSLNRPLCLWGGLFQCLVHCSLVTLYRLSQEFPSPPTPSRFAGEA